MRGIRKENRRRRGTFVCALFLSCLRSVVAQPIPECASLTSARLAYQAGDTQKTIDVLECLKSRHPEDAEVRRFLSDVYWWEGATDRSVKEAQSIHLEGNTSLDPELVLDIQRRLSTAKVSTSWQSIWGENHTGNEQWLQGDVRYLRKNHLIFGTSRQTKIFDGIEPLSDLLFYVGHSGPLSSRAYYETQMAFSPHSIFLPRAALQVQPHLIVGTESDLSLGARINAYSNSLVWILSPGWAQPIGSQVTVKLQGSLGDASGSLWGGVGSVEFSPIPVVTLIGSVAGGRTLEEPGLFSRFWQTDLELRIKEWFPWILHVNGEMYRGDLRSEMRLGLGVDVLF
jgi:hypothetical protein